MSQVSQQIRETWQCSIIVCYMDTFSSGVRSFLNTNFSINASLTQERTIQK